MPKTENIKQSQLRYKAKNYKRVPLDLRKEEYIAFKEYCDRTGNTINGLIRKWIKEVIEKEG